MWAWYRPETRMWKFSEDEMADGFVLMGVGMTTVFAFLSLLVGAMWAQAAFFRRFDIEITVDTGASESRPERVDERLQIAIALAAIDAHRRRQGI